MRLLHTTTLELHEFFGSQIPYYAILSHRWGNEEVTFQDLQQKRRSKMAGWLKIVGCCTQARKDDWEYVWIDTCCIDKSSSAELSEAINSMFQWYKNSQACYVYLKDIPADEVDHANERSSFRNSQWFRRGWTLQELLAPQTVVFFNCNWVEIGTKCTFRELIAAITGIDGEFLEEKFKKASVAQKFSWASKRETLRIEDTAYCLMGLFGVNMPLLYGEGSEAFIRLQLEIIKFSDDDSIFAWIDTTTGPTYTGLLANSPTAFRNSGGVIAPSSGSTSTGPYSMTNKGLSISLTLMPARDVSKQASDSGKREIYTPYFGEDQYFAPLSCYSLPNTSGQEIQTDRNIILLRLWSAVPERHQYTRLRSNMLNYLPSSAIPSKPEKEQIFVRQLQYDSWWYTEEGVISKFAIDAKYFFGNNCAISSFVHADFTPIDGNWFPSRHKSWLLSDTNLQEGIITLQLGTRKEDSMAFVQFDFLEVGAGFRDSFFLQIYRCCDFWSRTFGIALLPSNGTLLHEFFLDPRENANLKQRDRATITLPSGRVISAALKKRVRDSELVFAVDFDLK